MQTVYKSAKRASKTLGQCSTASKIVRLFRHVNRCHRVALRLVVEGQYSLTGGGGQVDISFQEEFLLWKSTAMT